MSQLMHKLSDASPPSPCPADGGKPVPSMELLEFLADLLYVEGEVRRVKLV